MNSIKLGTLIRQLEACNRDARVQFDFGGFEPTTIDSWRGVYAELAIGYEKKYDSIKVSQLLDRLREANGKTYRGYKGGEFVMDLNTQVWVDNYSEYSNTAIRGVRDLDYVVILETEYCP